MFVISEAAAQLHWVFKASATVGDSEQVYVLLRIHNFRAVFGGPCTLPVIYVTCVTYSFTLERFLYVIKTSYPKSGLNV